jgi:hypothetical protein
MMQVRIRYLTWRWIRHFSGTISLLAAMFVLSLVPRPNPSSVSLPIFSAVIAPGFWDGIGSNSSSVKTGNGSEPGMLAVPGELLACTACVGLIGDPVCEEPPLGLPELPDPSP